MSDPTSKRRFYVNLDKIGNGNEFLEMDRSYQNFLIRSAEDWNIWVERLVVPLNAVPFQDSLDDAISIVPAGQDPIVGVGITRYRFNETFSFGGFFTELNNMNADLSFLLKNDGRISIKYDVFDTNFIYLHENFANIFSLPQTIGNTDGTTANGSEFLSSSSVIDKIDNMHKVQIEVQGLPTESEYLSSSSLGSIITDFVVSPNISFSSNFTNETKMTSDFSVSYEPRQSIVYNASGGRRYIDMYGVSGVRNFKIECVAVMKDGTRRRIINPSNAPLSIKLGFVTKVK